MQQRGAAAAAGGGAGKQAGKQAVRPEQQVYTAPPGGPAGGGMPWTGAPLTAEELAARQRKNWVVGAALVGLSGYGYYITVLERPSASGGAPPAPAHLVNWSGTHECDVQRFHQPETLEQLEATVKAAHAAGE